MPNELNVTLKGHLSRDAEVKTSANGKRYCVFTIPYNYKWGQDTLTSWFRCVCFGELADRIGELKKGDVISITQSRVKLDEWKDKDGNERYGLGLTVWGIEEALPLEDPPQEPSDIPF